MSGDEIIGAGWAYAGGVDEVWTHESGAVEIGHYLDDDAPDEIPDWWVKVNSGDGEARFDVAERATAVAVADLLLAADRITSGANVALPEEFHTKPAIATEDGLVDLLGEMEFTPSKARRAGIDLLTAAYAADEVARP